MEMSEFFNSLRERKWILYIPERIYKAHHDGLLRGWGISEVGKKRNLFELLREQNADLKIPVLSSDDPRKKQYFMEEFGQEFENHITIYEDDEGCPPFPELAVASDALWDALDSRFNFTGSTAHPLLAWNNWVYSIRFCSVWTSVKEERPDHQVSELEWERKMRAVQKANRVLRKNYGLTGEYFGHNYTRRAILAVLKKAYPPEQVRHVRRQFEEKLRKDPAEVIRYALERGLVK